MMTSLIIDNNAIERANLNRLAEQIVDLKVMCEYCTAAEAYNHLQENDVDILFLNIEIPEMIGIELTKILLKKDLVIIFTTSKIDYAAEAFELNAADYLIKPVTPARFLRAIDKARIILQSKKTEENSINNKFLFVRDTSTIRRLKLDDILYAEAMGDYVKFYTRQKMYAIHGTMKIAEAKLPSSKFIRIHRSYIVALNNIDTIQDGGLVVEGRFLPIASAFRKTLMKHMNVF